MEQPREVRVGSGVDTTNVASFRQRVLEDPPRLRAAVIAAAADRAADLPRQLQQCGESGVLAAGGVELQLEGEHCRLELLERIPPAGGGGELLTVRCQDGSGGGHRGVEGGEQHVQCDQAVAPRRHRRGREARELLEQQAWPQPLGQQRGAPAVVGKQLGDSRAEVISREAAGRGGADCRKASGDGARINDDAEHRHHLVNAHRTDHHGHVRKVRGP
eukprot:scaffold87938_cov66-Phaeocystis_antarctica.AAC.3